MTESVDLPDLDERFAAAISEASDLRKQLEQPAATDGPDAIHRRLIEARRALDRVDELVVWAIGVRGRTRNALARARYELEAKEDPIYVAVSRSSVEFTTGRERSAQVQVKSLAERMEVYRLEQVDNDAWTVLDQLRAIHRGVDAARRDADAQLRLLTLERNLER